MIFVTLGTQKFQLNRLLIKLDELCKEGFIQEEVYAQIGNSDYEPENFHYVRFLDRDEFEKKIKEATLIITHSGVGSIIAALQSEKPVIVFPRLKKYREHVDNHQLEIAEAFSKKIFVLCCLDEEKLLDTIYSVKKHTFDKYISSREKIISIVKNAINE